MEVVTKGPVAIAARSAQICTCFDVGEAAIRQTLAGCQGSEDQRLGQLQGALQCGTNCGSCVPELRRLVKQVPIALVPA